MNKKVMNKSLFKLISLLFFLSVSSCANPYLKKNIEHSPCDKRDVLYTKGKVNVLAPCIASELDGQRFYLALGKQRFSYRFETNPEFLTGKMKVYGLPKKLIDSPDESSPNKEIWVFKESNNLKPSNKLLVERKPCSYKNIEFELSLSFFHSKKVYTGCGYLIR